MSKTLLEKIFFKPNYATVIVNLPKELETDLHLLSITETALNGRYDFILSFYTKKQDLEKDISKLKASLLESGLLWVAYPKNKALETDFNRDILHTLMTKHGLKGVSLVSLNNTWSAMRFKLI